MVAADYKRENGQLSPSRRIFLFGDLTQEEGLRYFPFALDGGVRNLHHFLNLFNCQAAEEFQFNDTCRDWIELCEFV